MFIDLTELIKKLGGVFSSCQRYSRVKKVLVQGASVMTDTIFKNQPQEVSYITFG